MASAVSDRPLLLVGKAELGEETLGPASCQSDQRLSRLFHGADLRVKAEPQFCAGSEQVKALSIDSGHHSRCAGGITLECRGMIVIHVLHDPRLLLKREWVLRHEFVRFDPVNLAESSDEPDANGSQAE